MASRFGRHRHDTLRAGSRCLRHRGTTGIDFTRSLDSAARRDQKRVRCCGLPRVMCERGSDTSARGFPKGGTMTCHACMWSILVRCLDHVGEVLPGDLPGLRHVCASSRRVCSCVCVTRPSACPPAPAYPWCAPTPRPPAPTGTSAARASRRRSAANSLPRTFAASLASPARRRSGARAPVSAIALPGGTKRHGHSGGSDGVGSRGS